MKMCEYCGNPVDAYQKKKASARFCSPRCAKRAGEVKRGDTVIDLSAGTVGAVHELVVAVDLMRRGYPTFRAMSPASPCDLIFIKGEEIKRVEVRTSRKTPTGGLEIRVSPKDAGRYDHYAFVSHDNEIVYVPEI